MMCHYLFNYFSKEPTDLIFLLDDLVNQIFMTQLRYIYFIQIEWNTSYWPLIVISLLNILASSVLLLVVQHLLIIETESLVNIIDVLNLKGKKKKNPSSVEYESLNCAVFLDKVKYKVIFVVPTDNSVVI